MSLAFSKNLASHLEQLILGPPIYERRGKLDNMVVYPLFPSSLSPDPPDMITLSEALNKGLRLNDTGVVSRIHVDNPLPTAILVGDSELLMGETQLRSVQFSCLIPAQKKASLPVSCVEEGRATHSQVSFTSTDSCPWPVRSFKMEQLARSGEPPQYWVWDQVKTYLAEAGTTTATNDIHAVMDQHSFKLQSLNSSFPLQPAQVGAICGVGQNIYMEIFGDPEIFDDRYEQILRSAMVEALVRPSDQVVPLEVVRLFMAQLVQVSQNSRLMNSRSLKDSGRSIAFAAQGISGQALLADNRLIHLSAHQKCIGLSRSLASMRPDLDAAQNSWKSRRPLFMDDIEEVYRNRRQRYSAFKTKLQSFSPSQEPPREKNADAPFANPPTIADRPQPLHPALRDFFLRLFSRD
jgi:hypothetical protein